MTLHLRLSNDQKDEIVICKLRANLVQRGFAVAIPRPDIIGEDLWFTREDCAPRLYLAQPKSMWVRDRGGRYGTNIALQWFMRALHQPNFLFVFGPLAENDSRDRFGFVPSSLFRGQQFLVTSKKGRPIVNLYLEVERDSDEKFLLHNGTKNGDRFHADVTQCFEPKLEPSLNNCLNEPDSATCRVLTTALDPPWIGKKRKEYRFVSKCDQCLSTFLTADGLLGPLKKDQ